MSARISEEWNLLLQQPIFNMTITLHNNDMNTWIATMKGPKNSPYAGGIFHILILFAPDYPISPPMLIFLTKIYHMNIHLEKGFVCHEILKAAYSPQIKVFGILSCVNHLLCNPNPLDPFNLEMAREYNENPTQYFEKARKFTQEHAGPLRL